MCGKTLLFALALTCAASMNAQNYTLSDVSVSGTAPKGIVVKGEALYIAFSGDNKVVKTSLDGKNTLLTITEGLNLPYDVDCDMDGRIFVANQGEKEIKVYDANGTLEKSVSIKKMNGDVVGSAVTGVTIGKDGKIYVAVGGSSYNAIHIYDSELKLIQVLDQMAPDNGIPGCDKLRIVRKVFFDSKGTMYISDKNTGVIVVDFYDDNVIYPFSLIKREDGINRYNNVAGITETSDGNLIIALDADKKQGSDILSYKGVCCFSPEGVFTKMIGAVDGSDYGMPYGLAVNADNDLYVADSNKNVVKMWKATGASGIHSVGDVTVSCFPNPFVESLTVELDAVALHRIELCDVMGRIAYSAESKGTSHLIIPTNSLSEGVYLLLIDGKASGGQLIKK